MLHCLGAKTILPAFIYRIRALLLALIALWSGCASIPSTPSPTPEQANVKIEDYFWQPGSQHHYSDSDVKANTVKDHTITVPSESGDFHISDLSNGSTTLLGCRSDGSVIAISELSSTSLVPLPIGGYFAPDESEIPIDTLPVYAMITLGTGLMLASTDTGVYASTDEGISWQLRGVGAPRFRIFAQDSVGQFLYGASDVSLLVSSDQGVSWTVSAAAPRGKAAVGVTAMCVGSEGQVFFGTSEGVFKFRVVSATFDITDDTVTNITSLALIDGSQPMLIAGTQSDGVWRWFKEHWQKVDVGQMTGSVFAAAAGKPHLAYAGSDLNMCGPMDAASNFWTPSMQSDATNAHFTSIDVNTADGRALALTSAGAIYRFTPQQSAPPIREAYLKAIGVTSRTIVRSPKGEIFFSSDKGIKHAAENNYLGTVGPFVRHPERVVGRLKLLTTESGLKLDSYWKAGNLAFTGMTGSIPITARVIDHFHELKLPSDPVSFGDTYVIRYAYEESTGVPSSLAPNYWLIYYTKAVGPTLIDNIDSKTRSLVSRARYVR